MVVMDGLGVVLDAKTNNKCCLFFSDAPQYEDLEVRESLNQRTLKSDNPRVTGLQM